MRFALLALCISFSVHAQQPWPTKPVRLVVANSAGAATDVAARVFADQLSRRVDKPIAVENRPGGDGLVGAQAVVSSPPDGYTLFFASQSTVAIDPNLRKQMPFDPVRDFTVLAVICDDTGPTGVFAHPSMPFNTLPAMVDYARANPGKITYGVTVPIFAMLGEWLQRRAGVQLVEVPYKNTPQATQDAVAGQVSLYIQLFGQMEPNLRAGKLKVLAVTVRQPDIANIPTVADIYPGFSMRGSMFLLGPAGMASDLVQRVNRETDAVVKNPLFNQTLKPLRWRNAEASARTPPEAVEFVRQTRERWTKFIGETGRQPE